MIALRIVQYCKSREQNAVSVIQVKDKIIKSNNRYNKFLQDVKKSLNYINYDISNSKGSHSERFSYVMKDIMNLK